jgi:predicted acetylornithine/succinylornithine family transaminase
MTPTDLIQTESKTIVPTYVRPEVVFTHGEGAYLYDTDGKQYLDFSSGIAVTSLGHSDPDWVAAVTEQAGQLTHVSNLYHTAPQVELAQRLVAHSFADRVYFSNSGAEANEAALKFARKFARAQHNRDDKFTIVAFSGGFHGRTIGSLSLTYKEPYKAPFAPVMPGVRFATFNDIEDAKIAIGDETCAVIVEPIQGEGGVNPAAPEFLTALRELCDQHNALLIFDEVQVGLGRTGTLWAHEQFGVTPDIMTLAKPLANGLPIGATLTTEEVATVMQPGDHGSTFAAGPLVCKAAMATFDKISQPQFLAQVKENSNYLQYKLRHIESEHIKEVRGAGFLVGVELNREVKPLIPACREKGLIAIVAGANVLRLAPPLIVSKTQIDDAVQIIEQALSEIGE